ncbi:JAB domain-containing protein [Natronogracilivirga saccharolytica]|uniref:JAB domain-containing protein n=1 Tax=Natronogracilivirga saccharolytica TaxID=2812953 RepID=A0A8J7RM45_9BACT|nr:JAB domain-containing protein [Natronogracilivirga saccharolytica]MBP3193897.1 JAB domain-containing protein [Natronogracilivirga saccharolytica]
MTLSPNIDNCAVEHSQLAEVQLKYRSGNPGRQPQINTPEAAVEYLRSIWDRDAMEICEEFVVLILNASKKCLGWCKLSRGGATATVVEPAHVFRVALLANAHSIVVAHNHPSGNTNFSRADINLTKKLVESGKLLDISVEDHIILTATDSVSCRQSGLM